MDFFSRPNDQYGWLPRYRRSVENMGMKQLRVDFELEIMKLGDSSRGSKLRFAAAVGLRRANRFDYPIRKSTIKLSSASYAQAWQAQPPEQVAS